MEAKNNMWIVYAFLSAFFAGITSILAKCGIKNTSSDIATAIRTVVVLIFAWLMVLINGSLNQINDINLKTWIFLILSGLATGASWLCYFKALKNGDINKVVPIDKSSIILTVILAFIILGEKVDFLKIISLAIIGAGTFMMIQKKKTDTNNIENKKWLIYAVLSAVFASLTSILGKIGMNDINSNLGTAIRTVVVLIMAWLVVVAKGELIQVKKISSREILFIFFSGISTGASWLCYYKALKDGQASIVVPIDKLSIIITTIFSYIVFKEKLSKKSFTGLLFIILGTLLMLI